MTRREKRRQELLAEGTTEGLVGIILEREFDIQALQYRLNQVFYALSGGRLPPELGLKWGDAKTDSTYPGLEVDDESRT